MILDIVRQVSTDSLVSTLATLQDFGTRYDFSPQREAAAAWLLNQYQRLGLDAHAEPFTYVATQLPDLDIVNDTCAYVVGIPDLLARTTDGGATWTSLSPGTSLGGIETVDFIDEQHGWIVTGFGACFRTSNGGNNWTASTISAFSWFHAVAFFDSLTGLAVGEGGKVYRTADGGASWYPCSVPVGAVPLRELKMLDPGHCWAVGDSGTVLFSQDAGLSWVRQNIPVKDQMYDVDFIDELHGWAAGGKGYWAVEQGEGSLLKTTDGGQTWSRLGIPPGAGCLGGVYAVDPLHLWIADPRGRLFQSTDGGQSWQMKLDLIDGGLRRFALRFRGNRSSRMGFVGATGLLYISGDGGATWHDRTGALPPDQVHTSSNIVAVIPGAVTPEREFLLLAHYDSRSNVSMTTAPGVNDNGTGTSLVLEAARVLSRYRFSSTLRFVAVSAEELGLIGSTVYTRAMSRRGITLIGALNTDMVGYPVMGDSLRLVVESYNAPSALSDSMLLYRTRYAIDAHLAAIVDSSASSDHVPLTQAGYSAVCLSEGATPEVVKYDPYLHTTHDSLGNVRPGMVRRATQIAVATAAEFAGPFGLSDVRPTPALPSEILLRQNYPNPFNPATTISFSLPRRSRVSLTIVNTLGQHVAELFNGEAEAGTHEVKFDGRAMPSGAYFYVLRTNDRLLARTMMILR